MNYPFSNASIQEQSSIYFHFNLRVMNTGINRLALVIIYGFLFLFITSFLPNKGHITPDNAKTLPIKYIYLTFDDGPLNGSENIDSVILAERLKISVFLVGEHAEKSKLLGTYYKMYEQNPFIESYNHSYTHARGKYKHFYSNAAGVLADIRKNEVLLNLKYKIVRLPGRNMWRLGNKKKDDEVSGAAAADTLANNGYKLYGWDLEWQHNAKDGKPIQTIDEISKEIETRLENGDTFTKGHIVILLHDEMFQKKWEESELKQLIDNLRKHENFVFEHIRFYPD